MFVRTLIITVLAALAAPSLAEESAAFGTQAQDAVAAASAAVETEKEAATEEATSLDNINLKYCSDMFWIFDLICKFSVLFLSFG